jgi:hypothetical protein
MVSRHFGGILRQISWLAAAAICAACEPGNVILPGTPTSIASLTITPAAQTLVEGQTGFVLAEVKGTGNYIPSATWTSMSPTIASVNASSGQVTANRPGSVLIVGTSTQDPRVTATATVTVTAKPDPAGQKYLGTFGVTAIQLAPVNSCFLSTYQGDLTLAAVGASPTGGLGVDFVITYGSSTRRYAGSVDVDGGFIASGIGPAGGTALLSGRVTVSPSGTATIVFDEQFACPSNGGATFRGAGERK